jgi:DNA-binding response OmpR family regulator
MATELIREAGYSGLIIGLTGLTSEEEHSKFMASGLDAILTKPMAIEALRAELAAYDARMQQRWRVTDAGDTVR